MKTTNIRKQGDEDITIYDVDKVPNRIERFFGIKEKTIRLCVSTKSGYITKERLK